MNATQLKSWKNAQPTLLKNSGKLYKKNKNLQKKERKTLSETSWMRYCAILYLLKLGSQWCMISL